MDRVQSTSYFAAILEFTAHCSGACCRCGDEIVKAALATYTFEHMEIGSYRILIATAEALADTETKLVCEQILREEENMARWLEENLPSVTKQYLDREKTSGVTAKH